MSYDIIKSIRIENKPLTLAEKLKAVNDNGIIQETFYSELERRGIKYSKKGPKVGGKKVGIHKYDNAVKYAAAYVYDNRDRIPFHEHVKKSPAGYQVDLFVNF